MTYFLSAEYLHDLYHGLLIIFRLLQSAGPSTLWAAWSTPSGTQPASQSSESLAPSSPCLEAWCPSLVWPSRPVQDFLVGGRQPDVSVSEMNYFMQSELLLVSLAPSSRYLPTYLPTYLLTYLPTYLPTSTHLPLPISIKSPQTHQPVSVLFWMKIKLYFRHVFFCFL